MCGKVIKSITEFINFYNLAFNSFDCKITGNSMANKCTYLTEELYNYLLAASVRPHAVLEELRQRTMELSMGHMQISPEQGQFMSLLIKLMRGKRTLEIGVFTGYSTLAVALALPEDGKIIACDVNKEWTDIAQEYWKKANVTHKIKLHLAPADHTLKQLIADGELEQFDFAFIDADKLSNDKYYELCLQLLKPGGLIMLDNVFMHYGVLKNDKADEVCEAIRQINLKLLHDVRVDISMLPMGDGVTLARKR